MQIRKADELFEMTSGLTVMEALDALRTESFTMFQETLLELKAGSSGQITLKTAMDTAAKLTTGLFEPIYGQIDPMRLREDGRSTRIAQQYGNRLNAKSQNLKPGALQRLIAQYPTHLFEIDREEAAGELFERVREPSQAEIELMKALGPVVREPLGKTSFAFIPPHDEQEPHAEQDNKGDSEGDESALSTASEGSSRERGPKERQQRPSASEPETTVN